MVVTFQLSRDEFYAIIRRFFLQRFRSWRAWICPGIFLALLVYGVLASDVAAIGAGALLVVLWLAQVFLRSPHQLWERFREVREPQTLTFTEEGMTEELAESRSSYPWTYWIELSRARDAYLLRSNKGLTIVPRRAFTSSADEQRFLKLASRVAQR